MGGIREHVMVVLIPYKGIKIIQGEGVMRLMKMVITITSRGVFFSLEMNKMRNSE